MASSSSTASPRIISRYLMAEQSSSGLEDLLNDLPEELLDLILQHLSDLSDLIRCRSVCRSWRFAAARKLPPLLLLCTFKTIFLSKDYGKKVVVSTTTTTMKEFDLPKVFHFGKTPCISSHRGWLLLLRLKVYPTTVYKKIVPPPSEYDHKTSTKFTFSQFSSHSDPGEKTPLYLFNPHSRILVKLREPPRPLCARGQLKFITSCSASDPNCIIYAYNLQSCSVAFYGLGDRKWSPLFTSTTKPVEAIFYNGHFYAVDDNGVLRRQLFDIDCNSYKEEVVSVDIGGMTPHRYLVEDESSSSGGGVLMMVVRRFDLEANKTNLFEIFKLNWRNGKWEEVSSLGDQALFLAHHNSKLVSVSVHNQNTIYFVDDLFAHWNSHEKDFGVYDLGNRTIQPLNLSSNYMGLPYCQWFQPPVRRH